MTTLNDLTTPCPPNWCPGCGNFSIWAAFKNACVEKDWNNENSVLIADIGCNGHIINFTKMTSLEGLHGRAIPTATGVKLANHSLNVFTFLGDGACLAEGGNHFLHVCRRNHDINLFLHDNAIYALTTGQTSPTTSQGYKSKSTPDGNIDNPLMPLPLAIAAGATFVARVYSGDIKTLQDVMIQAVEHRGTSIIDILQPCVTFHKECTHSFYQENTYELGPDHDVTNKQAAIAKAMEWGEKNIPTGIFYKEDKPAYEALVPQLQSGPIVKQPIVRGNIDELFRKYT